MCCLFGLIDYGHRLSGRQKGQLIRALARESEARGTDAGGIAYNSNGSLHIRKRPGPVHQLDLFIPEDAHVIMGHARMATQGKARSNRNNHPFPGSISGRRFALAHNGVLYNDVILRRGRGLPETKIETDSYIAVQLLEEQGALTPASLRAMAEAVEGSFVFTVLDEGDDLYFVKGDNPLCLVQFPRWGFYLYASTKAILRLGLAGLWLEHEDMEEIAVEEGEILHIGPDGSRSLDTFVPMEPPLLAFPRSRSRHASYGCGRTGRGIELDYLRQLKGLASFLGHPEEVVDDLLRDGWTTDEIEEALYGSGWGCF